MATTPSPLPIPHQMRTALDHYKFTLSLKTSVKNLPFVRMLCKSVRRCGQSKIIITNKQFIIIIIIIIIMKFINRNFTLFCRWTSLDNNWRCCWWSSVGDCHYCASYMLPAKGQQM